LLRTDKNGEALWSKVFGGPDWDYGYTARQTSDGGYMVAGYTKSFGAGGRDFYFIKTDENGDSLWTRTYGAGGYEHGRCAEQTSDGGYIMTGSRRPTLSSDCDIYVIKTDADGDVVWDGTYGGPGDDTGRSIREVSTGGYIVVGDTYSFGEGDRDYYVLRLTTEGDPLWTRTYGGPQQDLANMVLEVSNGGCVAFGHTMSFGAGGRDFYLLRLGIDIAGIGHEPRIGSPPITLHSMPNPCMTDVTIRYTLVGPQHVRLVIYNLQGREVSELVSRVHGAGEHSIVWDGKNRLGQAVPSGVYFCLFETADEIVKRKLVVTR
jgi:hypothetical protein